MPTQRLKPVVIDSLRLLQRPERSREVHIPEPRKSPLDPYLPAAWPPEPACWPAWLAQLNPSNAACYWKSSWLLFSLELSKREFTVVVDALYVSAVEDILMLIVAGGPQVHRCTYEPAAAYWITCHDTNRTWRTVLLMPVLHMFPNLRRDSAATIELLVESGIEVMHDCPEVAFQRVVVDRALPVAIDAIVHVGDYCLYCPIRNVHSRVFDDLSYDLFFKRAAMCEDPIGIVVCHGCPVTVLLFHHLFYHGFAIFVPW